MTDVFLFIIIPLLPHQLANADFFFLSDNDTSCLNNKILKIHLYLYTILWNDHETSQLMLELTLQSHSLFVWQKMHFFQVLFSQEKDIITPVCPF